MERRIKLLRIFAIIVAGIGMGESFFFTLLSPSFMGFLGFGFLYILYFSLLRLLLSQKRWRVKDGQEESTAN